MFGCIMTGLCGFLRQDVDANLYPAQLSGGMKKRVALARAVVGEMREGVEQVLWESIIFVGLMRCREHDRL